MRYLQAQKLEEMNINSFDKWASVFGETKTSMELKPTGDGQYHLKTRFASFTNLPELMTAFKECADIKLAANLNIERPKATIHNVNVPANRMQRRYVKKLGKRAEEVHSGNVDKHIDNMVKITGDGRKVGLDQRCIDPNLPDDPNSKVNECVRNVFDIWQKTTENKSTQLIFSDLATPKKEANENRCLVFRKQANGSYAQVYDASIRTKDKSVNKSFDSLKNNPPQAFKENEAAGVLMKGDIIINRIVDMKNELALNEGIIVDESGNAANLSQEHWEAIHLEPVTPFDREKRFCVYDDIKEKLVKMGIPENEIAFIHDCKNSEEQLRLFDKMNKGEVRVMIGSTSKCGAGMNAQQRMIALHDLDAPYRPSDMGQRHGRIERRGNMNKEVEIYRYMTEKTFDSYLYQLLENKQKFISQIMTEKVPVRVCEDIDEAVLDYAEAKALCSGNPLIKEKIELQSRIATLNNLKSGHNSEIYSMQDKIKDAPRKIQMCENSIEKYKQDKAAIQAVSPVGESGTYPMEIGGKVYDNKIKAGTALKDIINKNMSVLWSLGTSIEVAKYRGLTVSAVLVGMYDGLKEVKLDVKGENHYYCDFKFDDNIRADGNIIRIDNALAKIDSLIESKENEINEIKFSVEQAQETVNKPFEYEDELNEKTARLEIVDAELMKLDNEEALRIQIYDDIMNLAPQLETDESKDFEQYFVSFSSVMPVALKAVGDNEYTLSKSIKDGYEMSVEIKFSIDKEKQTVELISVSDEIKDVYEDYRSKPAQQNDYQTYLADVLEQIEDNDYFKCSYERYKAVLEESDTMYKESEKTSTRYAGYER